MYLNYDTIFSTLEGYDAYERSLVEKVLIPPDMRAEDNPTQYSFLSKDDRIYSGLIPYLVDRLTEVGLSIDCNIPELPYKDSILNLGDRFLNNKDDFVLRPYQISTIKKALYQQRGVLELATGSGKTSIAAGIIKKLLLDKHISSVLFVVGSTLLLEQAADRFKKHGLPGVGLVGSSYREIDKPITIALINSLNSGIKRRDKDITNLLQADCIIFDEVHHLSAKSWINVAASCNAPWRYGLTATLWEDPDIFSIGDLYLLGLTGPRIAHIPASHLIKQGYLAEPVICIIPISGPKVRVHPQSRKAWHRTYDKGICNHSYRNNLILELTLSLYKGNYKTMVFVNHIEHGRALLKETVLGGAVDSIFVSGGNTVHRVVDGELIEESWKLAKITDFVNNSDRCVLFGSIVMDEGLDLPQVNALIMAGGMKKHRRYVQRLGRGLRPKPGDNRVYVFDFMDYHHPFLISHSRKRVRVYELEEYRIFKDSRNYIKEFNLPINAEFLPIRSGV